MGRGKIRLKNLPALIQVTFVSVLTAAAWLRPLPRSRQFMVSKLAVIAIAVFVLAQLGSRLRELLLDRSVSCYLHMSHDHSVCPSNAARIAERLRKIQDAQLESQNAQSLAPAPR